jgi:hypothetical protein
MPHRQNPASARHFTETFAALTRCIDARRTEAKPTLVWIHGAFFTGKSKLATQLAPEAIPHVARFCTRQGVRTLMQTHETLILDDCERLNLARDPDIRAWLSGCTTHRGTLESKPATPATSLLIVISENPPDDPAVRARSFVVECSRSEQPKRRWWWPFGKRKPAITFSAQLKSIPRR